MLTEGEDCVVQVVDPAWDRAKAILLGPDLNRRSRISPHRPLWFEQILHIDSKTHLFPEVTEVLEAALCRAKGALEILANDSLSVFSLKNIDAASRIVLAAMHEPHAETILPTVFLEADSLAGMAQNFRQQQRMAMVAVHESVGACLARPRSALARTAADRMSATARTFWYGPCPSLKDVCEAGRCTARAVRPVAICDNRDSAFAAFGP